MIYLAALGLFLIAFLGMAIGVIIAKKPIQGSCGGLSALPGHDSSSPCDFCSKPKTECPEYLEAQKHCLEDDSCETTGSDSQSTSIQV